MKNQEICYWNGRLSTSREHVPPKCICTPGRKHNTNVKNTSE